VIFSGFSQCLESSQCTDTIDWVTGRANVLQLCQSSFLVELVQHGVIEEKKDGSTKTENVHLCFKSSLDYFF